MRAAEGGDHGGRVVIGDEVMFVLDVGVLVSDSVRERFEQRVRVRGRG